MSWCCIGARNTPFPGTNILKHEPSNLRVGLGRVIASVSVSSAILLTGCLTRDTGDADRLDPSLSAQIPAEWTAARIRVPEASATNWLNDFNSAKLRELARDAVTGNYDLAVAAARIDSAAARARISGANRLPQLDADMNVGRSQNLRGAAFQTVRANTFSTGLNLAWEVDLWGRLANLRNADLAELEATQADYEAARLSLAATVTRTALEIIQAKLQIDLSRETLRSLQTNLEILDAKLEAGDADDRTALEISLSRADVARAEATVAQQQRQADAARRTLETLLGDYPQGIIEGLRDLPALKRAIPAGLPSDLLLRRPDLVAAERRVDAQLQEVAAARKALLPSFRITGGAGTSTTQDIADLLDIRNLVWNIGGGLTQPIFEGGRLLAEIDLSESQKREIAAQYAETALNAFREVETTLAAEAYFRDQQAALEKAAEESSRAEQLSLSQYEVGLVDIITLLESQRRAFDSRSALLNVRTERIQNRIDLYLALGGDFDTEPEIEEAD